MVPIFYMHQNKTIVISGCTHGIGRAVAEIFAVSGFNVAGYARNQNEIDEMSTDFKQRFPNAQFLFLKADAANKKDVDMFGTKVLGIFGSVEVLINNAGYFITGSIMDEPEGTLENMLQTNLMGAYHLTRKLGKNIQRNIFNICSIASLQAYEAGASYTISKFAMLGFSKQLRLELKETGVKVTAILPGAVKTRSWDGSDLPDSRFVDPTDIAKTIYQIYCLSDGADVEELVIRPQLGDI